MAKQSEIKITKKVVDAAEPGAKRYVLWDSDTKGFGVRIGVSGVKTFVVKYLAEGGGRSAPQRFFTIGQFGPLTVELARKRAREIVASVLMGKDPHSERNAKRKEIRVSALIDLYEAEGCFIQRGKRQGQPMKPLTKKYTIARLRHHVVPLLGRKRVTEIGAADIERFFRDVESGKTAKNEKTKPRTRIIVKGGAGAARKVFRDLSAVFSFAKRHEIVAANPCEKAVVNKSDNSRTRFLTLEEVARLGAACDALEAEGVNSKALNITRLWVLTGCRRNEIAEVKWDEVDLENGLLVLDDSKTGKSIRPLCLAAATLLKGVEKVDGTDYVFPADEGDSYFQGTKNIWPKIVKKADLPGVTPHTLRHTVGATATSHGEALALTGAILGHANLRSTMIYAHVQHDPSVKAANRVGRRIASALAGEVKPAPRKRRKAAEPIPIKEVAPTRNGLLPSAEWETLTELAALPAGDKGFLASASDPALVMLAKRGFAVTEAGPSDLLAWWQISAVGKALIDGQVELPTAA
ncbi:integrase [Croceicoccus estronivorus]|uniref:tyrosine-type recombinase/integrase n=1 Tax=Croceicoccus estronivorus TaxID=1172626 RepID=UPI00082E9557|nr:site-specific integrase [Croceicoccus estronivorus]OCC23715.1 integrase [Croceicoccus estronivorus]